MEKNKTPKLPTNPESTISDAASESPMAAGEDQKPRREKDSETTSPTQPSASTTKVSEIPSISTCYRDALTHIEDELPRFFMAGESSPEPPPIIVAENLKKVEKDQRRVDRLKKKAEAVQRYCNPEKMWAETDDDSEIGRLSNKPYVPRTYIAKTKKNSSKKFLTSQDSNKDNAAENKPTLLRRLSYRSSDHSEPTPSTSWAGQTSGFSQLNLGGTRTVIPSLYDDPVPSTSWANPGSGPSQSRRGGIRRAMPTQSIETTVSTSRVGQDQGRSQPIYKRNLSFPWKPSTSSTSRAEDAYYESWSDSDE